MEDPTFGKHLVLKYYLEGWFPILGSWSGRLLFIDGFAGPGEYASGEPGSPLIALDCVKRCKERGGLGGVEIVFLFIESDKARADHLEKILKENPRPPGITFDILRGPFDRHMSNLLDYIGEQKAVLAPAFVMVDPFGIKGNRMSLISRILENEKSECMISFMYEPIRRFHGEPEFKLHLDELFGTDRWQKCFDMEETDKKRYLHNLFREQLKEHGAKHVVSFELWKGNRHIYTIYFTSSSLKGCNLMKQAIWRADPSGSYRLRGYAGNQGLLFDTDTEPLAVQLRERFGDNATPIEDIEQYVMSDETIFHKGQLRQKTLQRLEKEGRISVSRPQGEQRFTNGKGIKVRFHTLSGTPSQVRPSNARPLTFLPNRPIGAE